MPNGRAPALRPPAEGERQSLLLTPLGKPLGREGAGIALACEAADLATISATSNRGRRWVTPLPLRSVTTTATDRNREG